MNSTHEEVNIAQIQMRTRFLKDGALFKPHLYQRELPKWLPLPGLRKANIASGNDYREGWVNVDKYAPRTDHRLDLWRFPWPLASNEYDFVQCDNYLEHVPPILYDGSGNLQDALLLTLAELHRITAPKGLLHLSVPYAGAYEDLQNIAHYRCFIPESLDFCLMNPVSELNVDTLRQQGGGFFFKKIHLVVQKRFRWDWFFDSQYHPPKWLNRYWNFGTPQHILFVLEKVSDPAREEDGYELGN